MADKTWVEDKTLFWCGTYSYETRAGTSRTVERYAPDLKTAISQLVLQLSPTPRTETAPENTQSPAPETFNYATGFFITTNGYILTCSHTLCNGCEISVTTERGWSAATLVRRDIVNDIALLRMSGEAAVLPLTLGQPTKAGAQIAVVGFPNPQLQGIERKITKGSINSLTGLNNDVRHFQLDAAIQPGSSGSPVLSDNGSVVGMVVSRLDDMSTLVSSGALPQNVNYAVKSQYFAPLFDSVEGLLDQIVWDREAKPGTADPGRAVVIIRVRKK